MKKFFKVLGYTVLGFIFLILGIYLFDKISSQYNYNYKYSIAMPTIIGKYNKNNDFVEVEGLLKDFDNTESLNYSETVCDFKYNTCNETRAAITKGVFIFVYNDDFLIRYKDKNKIIFSNYAETKIGEIDLNTKKLEYTIKPLNAEINKIEVITDNKEIEKLEKKIIKKYLKKQWFK